MESISCVIDRFLGKTFLTIIDRDGLNALMSCLGILHVKLWIRKSDFLFVETFFYLCVVK